MLPLLVLAVPSSWTLSQTLRGSYRNDRLGQAVAVSPDGSTIAVGAPGTYGHIQHRGSVRVFEYSGGTWTQRGANLVGTNTFASYLGSMFGFALSLSTDGTILAVGAPFNVPENVRQGEVMVRRPRRAMCPLGRYRAFPHDHASLLRPTSQVYSYSGGSWSQLGATMTGSGGGDVFGNAVSLSADGTVLAVGSSHHDSSLGADAGVARGEYEL